MGAALLGPRVQHLKPGVHGSTFGGNPLACAVALAVLDVIRDERLPERAARLGAAALARLSALDLPVVRQVRGLGLMLGLELRKRVTPLLGLLQQRGLLALPAGPTVLRLLPPLTIPEEDLDRALTLVEEALREWGEAPEAPEAS
jgi:acetylornithine/LysW-gamma-L-lysine aminotransferase